MTAFIDGSGATSVGTCGSVRDALDCRRAAGVVSNSSCVPISPTGIHAVLAAGSNGAFVERSPGSRVARAMIGRAC